MLALHTGQGRAKLIQAESTLQPNEVRYIHLGYLLDGEQFPFHDLPFVTVYRIAMHGIGFRSLLRNKLLRTRKKAATLSRFLL
jgi:hypothetical protein